MRKLEPRRESTEEKIQKLNRLLTQKVDQKSAGIELIPVDDSVKSKKERSLLSNSGNGFHLENEQPIIDVEVDAADLVPDRDDALVYALIILDIAIYNQFNPLFMFLVLTSVVLISKVTPGKVRDTVLLFIALLVCYLPTTYTDLHPGLRQLYSCQNILFSLKIWNYLHHLRRENFSMKLTLMHFSHIMVFLRPQKPVTYTEIRARALKIPVKIGAMIFCKILTVLEIHPLVTILGEGFLFFTLVDIMNEIFAVYLMKISGWYIGSVFNEPYLATSPREFWGRRWNLWVQDFQYNNIFNPIRKAGYPNLVAFLCVNLFACAFHEYMVYVSWLSYEWSGKMCLFFTINFGAAMVEVYLSKSRILEYVPAIFCHRTFRNFLFIMFLATTGHLFVRPFFGVWGTTDKLVSGLLGTTLATQLGAN